MALVPDLKKFIQEFEIKDSAAVSQATWRKIGGFLNFLGHTVHQEKAFFANGEYGAIPIGSLPFTFYDGLAFFEFDAEIFNVWVFNAVAGNSGFTEIDLKVKPKLSGAFTSIFSTTPKIFPTAPAEKFFEIGDIATGIVAPVLAGGVPRNVNKGDAIRMDLLSVMPGAENAGIVVHFRPR